MENNFPPVKLGTLVYIRDHGKTLMLHRIKKKNDMHQDKWIALGGKIEPGETPEECALREVKEESGLTITHLIYKGLITFPKFDEIEDWYGFIFLADQFEGELLADPKEGRLEWIDNHKVKDLPQWEGDKIFLKWLDQPKIFSAKFIYDRGEYKTHSVIFY